MSIPAYSSARCLEETPDLPQARNHVVFTAEDQGWDQLENGDLLTASEQDGFEVYLTADTSGSYAEGDIPLPPGDPHA